MKNILVPTDFSDNALNALKYALSYFSNKPTCFYILHVNRNKEEWESEESGSVTLPPLKTNKKKLLQKQIEICRNYSTNSNHRFIGILEDNSLVETIRNQVASKDIEYIVIGTKGTSQSELKEIGSNAYEVVTKVKCPSIIVPEKAVFKPLQNLALPTDFNNWSKNRTFTTLQDVLNTNNSTLQILQIQNKNQELSKVQLENKDFLLEFIQDQKFKLHTLPNQDIDQEIQSYSDQLGIDMLAIVGRNLNFVQRLLSRPKPEQVTYHLHTPFLVLHE